MHWGQRFFNKETAEYTVNTAQFTSIHNHKIGSERAGTTVPAPLLDAWWDDAVYSGKPHPAQFLTSYFTRCFHAWAWDPALYIYPCKASCSKHDEGWRMLRASETHPFPEERGVNSRLYCCLGLPGFPRENIQRGVDAAKERHGKLFIEQVKRSGGAKWEEGQKTRREETEKSESRWQSMISVAHGVHRDLGGSCLQHLLNRTDLLTCSSCCWKSMLNLLIYGRESSCRG